VDAKEKLDLQAALDSLAEWRKDRHETTWEIDRINMICAKLENTDWFSRADQDLIIGALTVQQHELQDRRDNQAQHVHAGIIGIANRIYYAQNETERGEILQEYADWYHAQCVQDQNLEQINRITRANTYTEQLKQLEWPDQDAPPERDEVPF